MNSPAVGPGQVGNKWGNLGNISTPVAPPPPPPPPPVQNNWQQTASEKPPLPAPQPPNHSSNNGPKESQPLLNLPSPPLTIHQPVANSPHSPAVLTSGTLFGGPGLDAISSWEHFSSEPNYDLSPNPALSKPPPQTLPPPPAGPPPPPPPPPPAAAPPAPTAKPPAPPQPQAPVQSPPPAAHSKTPLKHPHHAGDMTASYSSTPPPPKTHQSAIQSPPAFLQHDNHNTTIHAAEPTSLAQKTSPAPVTSSTLPPAPQFVNYNIPEYGGVDQQSRKKRNESFENVGPHDAVSKNDTGARQTPVPLPEIAYVKGESQGKHPEDINSQRTSTPRLDKAVHEAPKPKPQMADASTNTESEKNRWQALDDLDKFYISSVRRFIAMVREEHAAETNVEKNEIFNEFFEHERIVRAQRYGIAIRNPTPPPAPAPSVQKSKSPSPPPEPALPEVKPLRFSKQIPNLGDGIAAAAHVFVESAKSTPGGGVPLGAEEQHFSFPDPGVPANTPISEEIKRRYSALLKDDLDNEIEPSSKPAPTVAPLKVASRPQSMVISTNVPEKKVEQPPQEQKKPGYQPFQPGISKVNSPPMSPIMGATKRNSFYQAFNPADSKKPSSEPSKASSASPASSISSGKTGSDTAASNKDRRRESIYKPYQAPAAAPTPLSEKRRSLTMFPTNSRRSSTYLYNDLNGEPKPGKPLSSPGRSPGRSPGVNPGRGRADTTNSNSGAYAAYPGKTAPQKRMSLSPNRSAQIAPLLAGLGQSKTPQPVASGTVPNAIPFAPPKSKTPQPPKPAAGSLPYPTDENAFAKPLNLGPGFQPPAKPKTPYPDDQTAVMMPKTGPVTLPVLPLVEGLGPLPKATPLAGERRSVSPIQTAKLSPPKSSPPTRSMTVPPQEMCAAPATVPTRPSTQKPAEKAVAPPPPIPEAEIPRQVPQMNPAPPLAVFIPPSDRILPNKTAMEEVESKVLAIGTDFSALDLYIKQFEKISLQRRIANDKARRIRSDEHEEDCDRLFAEGKVEYAELTDMDAQFKAEENVKREQEELAEYDLYIDTVYDPTCKEINRRLKVLTGQHHELLPILQAARSGREAFDPKVPGILLTEGLPLLLHLVQLIELHHDRSNQALIARDKKYRRMRTQILYQSGKIKEMKALEKELDRGERITTLKATQEHKLRIERLNEELENFVFDGVDKNIAFQDELDIAIKNTLRYNDVLDDEVKEQFKTVGNLIRELEGMNHHIMELLKHSTIRLYQAECSLEKAKVRVEAVERGVDWEKSEIARLDAERDEKKEALQVDMEEKRRLVSEEARKVLDTIKVGLK